MRGVRRHLGGDTVPPFLCQKTCKDSFHLFHLHHFCLACILQLFALKGLQGVHLPKAKVLTNCPRVSSAATDQQRWPQNRNLCVPLHAEEMSGATSKDLLEVN